MCLIVFLGCSTMNSGKSIERFSANESNGPIIENMTQQDILNQYGVPQIELEDNSDMGLAAGILV